MTDDLDRHFERLLRDPLTRRRILQRGAGGVLSASALAYLAACGTDEPSSGGDGDSQEAKAIAKGKIGDSLYMANWPLYIDEDRGTLKEFQQEYGAKVKYVEEINDNTEFFGKVRQQYDQGDSGGRDIHVVTDWMAARMIRLGYVQKFDKSTMPNANKNLIERLKSPPFDPTARLLDAVAVGHRRDHLPQGPGEARARSPSTTCSTRRTRARSRCSARCATRSASWPRRWAPTPRRRASTSS